MENVVLLLNLFYYEKIRYEIFRNILVYKILKKLRNNFSSLFYQSVESFNDLVSPGGYRKTLFDGLSGVLAHFTAEFF